MNITIKVQKAAAEAQVKAFQREWAQMQGTLRTPVSASGFSSITKSLNSMVGSIRSAGYAMTTAFTAPLVAAGKKVLGFTLDNQTAFAELKKVYGSDPFGNYDKPLGQLKKNFEALSNEYGVNQAEVTNVGAAWAAAGVEGAALAKSVDATMKAMVIGDLSGTDATKDLIAIQAQWGTSSGGLVKILNTLNAVENQTGVDMKGLIEAFSAASGTASDAGISYQQLAGMVAALNPAAGTAKQAGNSLKTTISRLFAPTQQASDLLEKMGIQISGKTWQSATGTQRIYEVAHSFEKLSSAQKGTVASYLASRFQISRFSILMRDVSNFLDKGSKGLSYYGIALNASSSDAKAARIAQNELNTVLNSQPHQLKQVGVMLKNTFSDIMIPLIPTILAFAGGIANIAKKFQNIDPVWQKIIGYLVLMLALLGPVFLYIAAMASAFGALATVMKVLLTPFTLVYKMISGLGGLIAKAVGSLFGLSAAAEAEAMTAAEADKAAILAKERRLALEEAASAKQLEINAKLVESQQAAAAAAVAANTEAAASVESMAADITAAITEVAAEYQGFAAKLAESSVAAATDLQATWDASLTAQLISTEGFSADLQLIWSEMLANLNGETLAGSGKLAAEWEAGLAAAVAATEAGSAELQAVWSAAMVEMATEAANGIYATDEVFSAGMAEAIASMNAAVAEGTVVWDAGLAEWVTATEVAMAAIDTEVAVGMAAVDGELEVGIAAAGGIMATVVAVLTSPWTLAIAAVLAVGYAFRDKLAKVWHDIVQDAIDLFNQLPQGVQNAMQSVVDVVASAAKQVYEFFSYINPFAHHSPSLVENVNKGFDQIIKKIKSITDIQPAINEAYNMLAKFSKLSAPVVNRDNRIQVKAVQKDIRKAGGSKAAADDYAKMNKEVLALTRVENGLNAVIEAQTKILNTDQAALDSANATLDAANKKLDALTKTQSYYSDMVDKTKQDIQDLANTQIQGQQAMSDAIFANTMAQKKLQLQMMKMEDVTGPIDDVSSKLQSLAGDMMVLQGTRDSLREGGAGSDILGGIDSQMSALKSQQTGLQQTATAYQNLSNQLTKLQTQGQELDLENSLKFDPLTRQIDQLANGMKELPFDQIVAGIKKDQASLKTYTADYDAATAAVVKQQAVVDQATKTRDAAQAVYDKENLKVQKLQGAYDALSKTIGDLNDAMQKMASAAADIVSVNKSKTPKAKKETLAEKQFDDAAKGNFKSTNAGLTLGGDKGGSIDAETQKALDNTRKSFGKLDLLGPFKGIWKHVTDWWDSDAVPAAKRFGSMMNNALGGVDLSGAGSAIASTFSAAWNSQIANTIKDMLDTIGKLIGWMAKLAMPDIVTFFKNMWGAAKDFADIIGPKLQPLMSALGGLFKTLWELAKPFVEVIGVTLIVAMKILAGIFNGVLRPAIDFVADGFGYLIDGLTFLINFVTDVINGKWGKLWKDFKSFAINSIKDVGGMFGDIGKLLWGALEGLDTSVAGIFKSIGIDLMKGGRDGVLEGWKWLKDGIENIFHKIVDWFKSLFGIHSPSTVFAGFGVNLIEGIVSGLESAGSTVLGWFTTFFKMIWDGIKSAFDGGVSFITGTFSSAWSIVETIITNPISLAKDALGIIWDDIKSAFTSVSDWVSSTWSKVWDAVKDAVMYPIDRAKEGLANDWTLIKDAFTAVKDWVINTWSKVWNGIKDTVMWPVDRAKEGLANDWSLIKTAFTDVKDWVISTWSKVWNAVKSVVTTPISDAKGALDTIWGNLKQAFTDVKDWVTGTWSKVWNAIKSTIMSPINDAKDAIGKVFDAMTGKGGLFPTLVSDVQRIWSGLKAIFEEPIKFLVNTVLDDGIIKGWNWVADKIPGVPTIKEIPRLATGGAVRGPGTGTSDSVPALLSNNEHVWTAREVQAAGGHSAVEHLRQVALHGRIQQLQPETYRMNGIQRFADGGAVKLLTDTSNFIKSTDPLPYVFGDVGPNAYDCSGLVGAVWAKLEEKGNPFERWFSTSNEANYFSPGSGFFTVGVTNSSSEQHTAGRLGNMKFEARDTAEGIIIGDAAKAPESFMSTLHLPKADDLMNEVVKSITSGGSPISAVSSAIGAVGSAVGNVVSEVDPITYYNQVKDMFEKANHQMDKYKDTDVGKIIAGAPAALAKDALGYFMGFVKSAESAIASAASNIGGGTLSTNASDNQDIGKKIAAGMGWTGNEWTNLQSLWNKESGWSNTADTRVTHAGGDGPNSPVFAYGIAQSRPATKYPLPGRPPDLGGVSDPTTQIKWGLNYIKSTYGTPSDAWWHETKYNWYDQGGMLPTGRSSIFNGTGRPELIAPQKTFERIINESNTTVSPEHPVAETHETHIHIGELSLPGIKNQHDAQGFIDNLKVLSRGH